MPLTTAIRSLMLNWLSPVMSNWHFSSHGGGGAGGDGGSGGGDGGDGGGDGGDGGGGGGGDGGGGGGGDGGGDGGEGGLGAKMHEPSSKTAVTLKLSEPWLVHPVASRHTRSVELIQPSIIVP